MSDHDHITHPSAILLEQFMRPNNITPALLAQELRVHRGVVDDVLFGGGSITAGLALRLGHYFSTSPELWLSLQAYYDLKMERRVMQDFLNSEITPLGAERLLAVQVPEATANNSGPEKLSDC